MTDASQTHSDGRATLIGFVAIAMWSLLALLTAGSGDVPPFQLLAMTFAIGTVCGLVTWVSRKDVMATLRLPAKVWMFGIFGLFGYHFFYYTALRNAPVAEAGLIAYLWPLLIVLGSTLLPGERLRWWHVLGAVTGFCGAALLIGPGGFGGGNALGYASAFACAFIWSAYSVISRLFKAVPTDAVVIYCAGTCLLGLICHVFLEQTVWPGDLFEWLAIAGLGLMPVGIAFYVWDHGVKHGNIQLLGSLSYGAPVLSTLVLIGFGFAKPSPELLIACVLVTLGAVIASGVWRKNRAGDKDHG